MAIHALIEELLIRGADHWITAAEVAWVAKSLGGARSSDEIRTLSLDLIQELLNAGLMEADDVTAEGFVGWRMSPTDARTRIQHSWERLNHIPGLGEVCWLANTNAAKERVESSLTRPQ